MKSGIAAMAHATFLYKTTILKNSLRRVFLYGWLLIWLYTFTVQIIIILVVWLIIGVMDQGEGRGIYEKN